MEPVIEISVTPDRPDGRITITLPRVGAAQEVSWRAAVSLSYVLAGTAVMAAQQAGVDMATYRACNEQAAAQAVAGFGWD